MLGLGLMFFFEGLLLAGIAIPLIQRKIPINGMYGFRVKKTMESDDIWYPANEYSGRLLFLNGLFFSLMAVVLPFVPKMNLPLYATLFGVITIVTLSITFLRSMLYIKKL